VRAFPWLLWCLCFDLSSCAGPYQNSPCHIELILEEEEGAVARPEKEAAGKKKVSKKKLRREAADAAPGLDMD
jgi:hypothetical protein